MRPACAIGLAVAVLGLVLAAGLAPGQPVWPAALGPAAPPPGGPAVPAPWGRIGPGGLPGPARQPLRGAAVGPVGFAAEEAPSPGRPAPEVRPEPPPLGARFTLPNGLVVLVAERPGLPIVTVRVAVAAGAVLDPPGRAGLANLTARLLPRGTRTRSGPEIDRAVEFVGGSLEAGGGRDGSELTLAVLRRDLALGLDLLADVLRGPRFPAAEVEREREEVLATLRRQDEDPEAVAARHLRALVFPGHPYARPVEGTETSLAALTREDVAAFYATAYRPEATVIAVAGDVTADEVRRALEPRLGDWTVGGPPPAPPGWAVLGTPAGVETLSRPLAQATALVGKAIVTRPHPDYYPLVVATHLLGGGSSSRLYTRVREDRGLAYSVYAQYVAGRYGGLFLVGLQSENRRVREGLAVVHEELARMRREPVEPAELARAKAYLVGSFPLRMDTTAETAGLLLTVERFGFGLDYPARYRRAVEAVTAEDVRRVALAHWDPALMSRVVVGDLAAAGLAAR